MYTNLDTTSSLDQEYLTLLQDIKPYITCIINKHYLGLIKLWMERLSNEDFAQKFQRNSYLHRLYKQLEVGVLEYPFTEPPPEGELAYFTDDENESFYAAQEVLFPHFPQESMFKAPTRGQGDVPMIDTSSGRKSVDEESSWLDITDCSSGKVSERKQEKNGNEHANITEKLRFENRELRDKLIKCMHVEESEVWKKKMTDLQKQLASAMIRNVELQKNIQNEQRQREESQTKAAQCHNELEILRTRYAQVLKEHEDNMKETLESLTKKNNASRDKYVAKISDLEKSFQLKCTVYQQKIVELKGEYDEEVNQLKSSQQETNDQLKAYELKFKELHEQKEQREKQMEGEIAKHADELEKLRDEEKQKYEVEMSSYKRRTQHEEDKHQRQNTEKLQQLQNELKQVREERHKSGEQLTQLRRQLHEYRNKATMDQALQVSCDQSPGFKKKNEELTAKNRELAGQVVECRKLLEERRVQFQSNIESLQAQIAYHQKQLEELQISKVDKLQHELESLQKQIKQQHAANESHIAKQREAHEKQLEDLKTTQQEILREKIVAHNNEIQSLERSMKEQHEEDHKGLQKIQMEFNENLKVLENQVRDTHKMEVIWRDELLRVLEVVKKLRSEKSMSKQRMCCLEQKLIEVQDFTKKERAAHQRVEKELSRRFKKLSCEYEICEHKYRMLFSSKIVSPRRINSYDRIIIKLEEKYKRSLAEQYAASKKDRENYTKRIADLELRLGLSYIAEIKD